MIDRTMKYFLVLLSAVFASIGIFCPGSQKAFAVEVFVNGHKFSSMKDYREKRAEEERASSLESEGEAVSLPAGPEKTEKQQIIKGLPFDFDPAKGKTVIISHDGSLIKEKGVTAFPDGAVFDPSKGKTIEIQAVSSSQEDRVPAGTANQSIVVRDNAPQILDRGRIAGVQPPLAQVVEQFQKARGVLTAQRGGSSSLELEEWLRKTAQNTEGVVLLVAGSGKVRLYDLRGLETTQEATDGQKTR